MAATIDPVKCRWKKDTEQDIRWNTECGYVWWLKDIKQKCCPHCGKEIEEVTDGSA